MIKNKTILITGASSGIGKWLALTYAKEGVNLLLTGRDKSRLDNVKKLCEEKDATVEISTIPVTDTENLSAQITEWDEKYNIDIVIANAGISGGTSAQDINNDEQFKTIIDVNLGGTFNTVNPLIPRMIERKSGHIVLMSSMAGFRGLPSAPAYSISKVAVRAYGDALRPLLKPEGIIVSTVFPGFVKTPMTAVNKFPMPFLIEADKAAEIIKTGIENKKTIIAFPFIMHLICWYLSVIPRSISDWVLSYSPKK